MSTNGVNIPFGQLTVAPQREAPWYVITFDKAGRCTSPVARNALIDAVASGAFTQVLIFAHGWNNTWAEVEGLNRALIGALNGVWPATGAASAPGGLLVVSIFWPSVALLAEDERGPSIAAGDQRARDALADDQRALDVLADALPKSRARKLRKLAARSELNQSEADELAELLASLLKSEDEVGTPPPSARELQTMVRAVERPPRDRTGGISEPTGNFWPGIGTDPSTASTLGWNWRTPARVATVYLMKQRAGLVGTRGVRKLLHDLLAANAAVQLHLGGHSYGCRVMLSAICAERPARPYSSLLLLQPAVSRYCFAEHVPTSGRAGGYRSALERVRQPLLLTYSAHDAPLHKLFGLAMFLARDIGEPDLASPFDNIYAALGGYGPAGVEFTALRVQAPGTPYQLAGARRIIALDGSWPAGNATAPAIRDHGDVATTYTGWMLYHQLSAL